MENMYICNVGVEEGCGYQDENNNIFTTASFSSFGSTAKEVKYLPSTPKVRSWHGRGSFRGLSLFYFNPSIASEIFIILYLLTYQVWYALYGS